MVYTALKSGIMAFHHVLFFFSSRRRHTRSDRDWSSDVCSSDLAPTLHDLPVPQPAEGELLVRVEASSVNGFDMFVVSGMAKGMIEYRLPIVLGKDFAGTVEAAGPGVTGFAVGDPVFGVLMTMTLGDGTFTEHVAAAAMFVAKIPEGLPTQVAGALGLAGASAMAAID